jgi:glutathione S-transferase
MTPELLQFRFSHYNEKARWGLDFKAVRHVRRSFLPAPHMLPIWWLSGQRSVPVLRLGREVVVGSGAIIDHLETRHPDPPLYPAAPSARHQALELQRWLDDEIGPAVRRAFFFDFLVDGDYAARTLAQEQPAVAMTLYRALFPLTRTIMRLDMGIAADGAARGRELTQEALDRVARMAGPDGYLVGDRFTVADLTAASLLSPTLFPPECQARILEPRSPGLQTWLARWAGHPGVAWIARIFARHRGTSAEA